MSDFKVPQGKYYQREYFSIDEKYKYVNMYIIKNNGGKRK